VLPPELTKKDLIDWDAFQKHIAAIKQIEKEADSKQPTARVMEKETELFTNQ